jgi:hypothetical protein
MFERYTRISEAKHPRQTSEKAKSKCLYKRIYGNRWKSFAFPKVIITNVQFNIQRHSLYPSTPIYYS